MATLHEDLRREDETESASERSFGLLFAVVFALLAVRSFRHHGVGAAAAVFAGASLGCVAIALLVPRVLRPFNRLWFLLGLVLYKVVSPVVMAVLYYLAVVPTGLVMKALGKDPLRLRTDRAAASYWIPRETSTPVVESMRNQF
jgi:hypothetical protein